MISNLRDLSRYIQFDLITEAYINALGLLIMMPDAQRLDGGGFGIPFDRNNPYRRSCTQEGFVTFGPTHIISLLNKVAYAAPLAFVAREVVCASSKATERKWY